MFAPALRVIRSSMCSVWVVINPDSGPRADDAGLWKQFVKDAERAFAHNPNTARNPKLALTLFGYVDAVLFKRGLPVPRDPQNCANEVIDYLASYKVRNIFLDDVAADVPAMSFIVAKVRGVCGRLITNPGEALPASHWLWAACDAVIDYEGNEPAQFGHLSLDGVKPGQSVRIVATRGREHAAALWKAAQAAKLAALAIVEDAEYQMPPSWW